MRKRRGAIPVGAALDVINCGLRRRMEKADSWSGLPCAVTMTFQVMAKATSFPYCSPFGEVGFFVDAIYGKTTERNLEKLPNESRKSCRTKFGKIPNGHCAVSRFVIKYAANEKISPKNC